MEYDYRVGSLATLLDTSIIGYNNPAISVEAI
jgi:hypothetical protein